MASADPQGAICGSSARESASGWSLPTYRPAACVSEGRASSITLHLRADSAAGRPIEPVKAEPALPHMQHHFGYGWFDDSARSWTRASSARGTPSTVWEGNGRKHAPELHASPHPYLLPSQRLHGNVLDSGQPDTLPPRASRKPNPSASVQLHSAQFMSWPGTALFVPSTKHHWKPDIDSRHERRGELPPTAQLLVSPGSRQSPFPVFGPSAFVRG